MPSMPKWLGDTMETAFRKMYHPVKITEVEYLYPQLKRVRLEGDLYHTKFTPGNVIEFRVTPTDYRHYTPSFYNKENGVCEVLFYIHDKGVGSEWASKLKTGMEITLLGPGGKLAYQKDYIHQVVFGDETSFGLMQCMQQESKRLQQEFYALMESNDENINWIKVLPSDVKIESVQNCLANPAEFAIKFLEEKEWKFWQSLSQTCFYLTGRAKAIQAVRKWLLTQGIAMKQIKTEPY